MRSALLAAFLWYRNASQTYACTWSKVAFELTVGLKNTVNWSELKGWRIPCDGSIVNGAFTCHWNGVTSSLQHSLVHWLQRHRTECTTYSVHVIVCICLTRMYISWHWKKWLQFTASYSSYLWFWMLKVSWVSSFTAHMGRVKASGVETSNTGNTALMGTINLPS